MFSSVECLGGGFELLLFCGFWACRVLGLRAWIFACLEPLVYTACVLRSAFCFSINYYLSKNKKKVRWDHFTNSFTLTITLLSPTSE